MLASPSILLYGHDDTLLFTRSAILNKAGFQSFPASNLKDVRMFFSSRHVELIVICQTVSHTEAELAMSAARAFNPKVLVLALNGDVYEVATWASRPASGGIQFGSLTARNFLNAVEDMLRNANEVK